MFSINPYILRHSGPGLPLPTGLPSIEVTATTPRVAALSQTSSAARNCVSLTGTDWQAMPEARASSSSSPRVVPGSNCAPFGGVWISPSQMTCTLDALASDLGVHRATVARHLAAARTALRHDARRRLQAALGMTDSELTSLAWFMRSQLDLSLPALLRSG